MDVAGVAARLGARAGGLVGVPGCWIVLVDRRASVACDYLGKRFFGARHRAEVPAVAARQLTTENHRACRWRNRLVHIHDVRPKQRRATKALARGEVVKVGEKRISVRVLDDPTQHAWWREAHVGKSKVIALGAIIPDLQD